MQRLVSSVNRELSIRTAIRRAKPVQALLVRLPPNIHILNQGVSHLIYSHNY